MGSLPGKGQQIPTEKLALTPQIKQHLSINLMLLCGWLWMGNCHYYWTHKWDSKWVRSRDEYIM